MSKILRCVVCPINNILYKDVNYAIPTLQSGAVIMSRIAKELNDIQYGRLSHEWAQLAEE